MLVAEIFVRFGHSNGGETGVEKRAVIAAPKIAVAAIDNVHGHPANVFFGFRFYESRQFACGAVVLAASAHQRPQWLGHFL